MLHGYVIIVKRTGADGSKFPVTEREIKIGTSPECRILINTPYVQREHCAILVRDDGQVWVKNLSTRNPTVVNEIPIAGEKLLSHGDSLEIGGRLVRWEYLPDSKYYSDVRRVHNSSKTSTMPTPPKLNHGTPKKQKTPKVKTPKSLKKTASVTKSPKQLPSTNGTLPDDEGENLRRRIAANMAKIIKGRKSLQTTRLLFSPVDRNRRKTEAIRNLQEKDLREMTNVRRDLQSPRTPIKGLTKGSPSGRQPTPIKRLSSPARAGKRGWSMKAPCLITIREAPTLQAKAVLLTTKSPSAENTSPCEDSSVRPSEKPAGTSSTPVVSLRSLSKTPKEQANLSLSETGTLQPVSPSVNLMSETSSTNLSISKSETPLSTLRTPSPRRSAASSPSKRMSGAGKAITPSPLTSASSSPTKMSALGKVKTPRELMNLSISSSVTPPEVVTPVCSPISPAGGRGRKRQSPTTPSLTFIAMESAAETPPEVVTPQYTSPEVLPKPSLKKSRVSPLKTPARGSPRSVAQTPLKTEGKTPPLNSSSRSSSLSASSDSDRNGPNTPENAGAKSKLFKTPTSSKSTQSVPLKGKSPAKTPSPKSVKSPHKTQTPVRSAISTPSTTPSLSSVKTTKKTPSPLLKTNSIQPTALSVRKEPPAPTRVARRVATLATRKNTTTLKNSKKTPNPNVNAAAESKNFGTKTGTLLKQKVEKTSRISKVLGAKAKLPSRPDKNKKKALLVLGKASEMKFKTEVKIKQKLVKKAIRITNKPQVKILTKAKETPEVKALTPSPRKDAAEVLLTPPLQVSPSSSSAALCSVLMELPLPNVTPPPFGRRSSKRISSKNDPGRPDFTELSPTALGLTPRHVPPVHSTKNQGRRSISLTTPRVKHPHGIIKAVSTSKKLSRKSVIFSPGTKENESGNSSFNFNTPDISQDVFVSPLLTPGSNLAASLASSSDTGIETGFNNKRESVKNMNVSNNLISFCTPDKIPDIRLKNVDHQSPFVYMNELSVQAFMGGTRDSAKKLSPKSDDSPPSYKSDSFIKRRGEKNPYNSLSDVALVESMLKTPNDFSEVEGVGKLLRTPKPPKSPKNDLFDVVGVKRVMAKSPKNDLRRIVGIKKMFKTPARKVIRTKKSGVTAGRPAKSPKNDLTDVRGVKQIFQSPQVPNSPKNDLTDVRGVKALLRTQKSPKNDLTDVSGVKRILANSPKNDLRRVVSLKKLMKTPVRKVVGAKKVGSRKPVVSPKNDLTNVHGVKMLLGSPRPNEKSPKNRLSDLRGVKRLMLGSPPPQKSPRNDLTDVQGLRTLFASPKQSLTPRNDLRLVQGVKELFATPEAEEGGEPLSSPVTVERRARGKPATPAVRPSRSRKAKSTDPAEAPSQVLETATVRPKRKATAKSDAPPNLRARRNVSTSSSSRGKKEAAASTPPRRGRPKRVAAVPETATESANEKESAGSGGEKPRTVRGRAVGNSKIATSKRKKEASSTSPSPKKRATRAAKVQGSPSSARGGKVKTSPSQTRATNRQGSSSSTRAAKVSPKRATKVQEAISSTRARVRKTPPALSPVESLSPKTRTRGGRGQLVSSTGGSPSPKIRTRGRVAAAKQKPIPAKRGRK